MWLLVVSTTITISVSAILSSVYYYIYKIDKNKFIRSWSLGWLFYSIGLILSVYIIYNYSTSLFWGSLKHIFFYISGIFLFNGSYIFTNKKPPKYINSLWVIGIWWIIIGYMLKFSLRLMGIPIFVFSGVVFIWCGVMLENKKNMDTFLLNVIKIAFIIHGINNISYPIVNIEIYLAFGYTVGAITKMIIAISFMLIYFENSKKELIEARNIIDKKEKKIKDIIDKQQHMIFETELFYNVSHDFKTPLNVILSSIQLIEFYKENNALTCDDGKKLDRYIRIMKQNCYKLIKQINNLIDMNKLDTGFYTLNLNNYNIVQVVEDITLSILDYTESKKIELIFDTDIEEKIMAFDIDKIERIILNLLSNAIKFTFEDGKIFVNINCMEDKVIISVKDTGKGIPKDRIPFIFDRYYQVNEDNSLNTLGSGIGLSIVKSLVELHKGKISVSSTYGSGCEFIIELPCLLVDKDDNSRENAIINSKKEKIGIELSDL